VQAADHSWHKPTLDLSLPGKLAFPPRYGLETHHLLCLEPSHLGVAISPMWRHGGVLAKQTAAFAEDVAKHAAARVWDSLRGMCCLLGS
jgi:hypothetical protein